ncbi:hypothetical protein [Prosthecodimorpha staleyi]|uniref:Uncharacterized protein n=1 Tax=Prosthecodimorpha staleyi TaxID=2840188 RepID=A0A947D8N4_9HYPH|nr:hypothetical protein [Prosthecodimorpha staleyi]MBT9288854.1 hypothetical protein [Prosthecodimorpha staleyi]
MTGTAAAGHRPVARRPDRRHAPDARLASAPKPSADEPAIKKLYFLNIKMGCREGGGIDQFNEMKSYFSPFKDHAARRKADAQKIAFTICPQELHGRQ